MQFKNDTVSLLIEIFLKQEIYDKFVQFLNNRGYSEFYQFHKEINNINVCLMKKLELLPP